MERVAVRSVERGAIRVARGHEVELAAAEVPGAEEAEGEGEGAGSTAYEPGSEKPFEVASRYSRRTGTPQRVPSANGRLTASKVSRTTSTKREGGGSPACSSGYIRTRRA